MIPRRGRPRLETRDSRSSDDATVSNARLAIDDRTRVHATIDVARRRRRRVDITADDFPTAPSMASRAEVVK
tara:strand:+ start:1873 stop:2088 length:216 start_codon:yes stop_codon:yes gene_type:complete